MYGKNFFKIRKELLPQKETVSHCDMMFSASPVIEQSLVDMSLGLVG